MFAWSSILIIIEASPVILPSTCTEEKSLFPPSLANSGHDLFLDLGHSVWSEMKSQSDFSLHFTDGLGCWTLKMYINQPFVFLLLRAVCLPHWPTARHVRGLGWFLQFFMYSGRSSAPCLRYCWQIFSYFEGCLFTPLIFLFSVKKFFNFI